MKKDYYKILDISQEANEEEIKKAYRKQALKYHPDKNKGDKKAEENFKKISEAYGVLSDPEKKNNYDTYGDGYLLMVEELQESDTLVPILDGDDFKKFKIDFCNCNREGN